MFKYFLIILIAFSTLIPRTIQLFDNRDYFGPEPGIDYLMTKEIVVDHKFPLISYEVGGIGGFSKGPGWNYILAIPFILSDGHPYAMKLFMYLLSILAVLFGYVFTNKIFGRKTALFVTFFLATSPILIDYAKGISPPWTMPIVLVFYLYSLIKVFQKKINYSYLVALSVGIMTHLEMAIAGVLLFQLVIYSVFGLFKQFIKPKQIIISFLLFLSTLFPLLIYDISKNFHNIRGVLSIGSSKTSLSILQHLDTFVWNFRSTFSPHILISIFLFLLLLAGTHIYLNDKKIKQYERLTVFYLATSPVQIFILFLLYPGNLSGWWLSMLSVFYLFLGGILASYFVNKKKFKVIVLFAIFVLFFSFAYRTYIEFKQKFVFPPKASTIRVLEPIEYIYKDAAGNDFSYQVLPVYRHPDRRYDYESMFWWIGKNIGSKSNIDTNAELKYIIVEPEEKNLNMNGGPVKKFPSGIAVYKILN